MTIIDTSMLVLCSAGLTDILFLQPFEICSSANPSSCQKLTKIYVLRSLETGVKIGQSHRVMLYVKYCDCRNIHTGRSSTLQNRVQQK